jgi:hypothetical protein
MTDWQSQRRVARRTMGGLVGLAVAVLGVFAGIDGARAQVAPQQAPLRGAFAGTPPRGEGIALLTTTDSTTAAGLTASLTDAGCLVETISVLRSSPVEPPILGGPAPAERSDWTPFVAGAPAAANEGFIRALPVIPANTPFFLRCRSATSAEVDPANARYRIGSVVYTLLNGRSDIEAAPGSATRIVTVLGARRAYGDLDRSSADAAVVLEHQPGGSGTFSYLAVTSGGSGGTAVGPTVLLGDRVLVTRLAIVQGRIEVSYMTRYPAEPFTFAPTLTVTKVFTLTGGALVEVGSIVG